jgi:hypothetical protein
LVVYPPRAGAKKKCGDVSPSPFPVRSGTATERKFSAGLSEGGGIVIALAESYLMAMEAPEKEDVDSRDGIRIMERKG